MKKYSSYADLKLNKNIPSEMKSPKAANSSSFKKNLFLESPVMAISKDYLPIPSSTKFSAGYLQKKKNSSSKKYPKQLDSKQNKSYNLTDLSKNQLSKDSDKSKRFGKKQVGNKKQKVKVNFTFENDYEQRLNVQSPKANGQNLEIKIKQKEKNIKVEKKCGEKNIKVEKKCGEKSKEKEEKSSNKENLKERHKCSGKLIKKSIFLESEKKQQNLNDFVTKYEPQPQPLLLKECISDSNLLKGLTNNYEKSTKGYYISSICNAFFSNKTSSIQQICKNHVLSSIDFLSYASKKNLIPNKCSNSVTLSQKKAKTIIFDLDETLIHCNQTIDIPYDICVEIKFPNNCKINAGINIRPYAVQCLKELSKKFQIIVFTASHSCYANQIINYLDPQQKYISHRLFRQHCFKTAQGFYVKDLRILNRNLDNVLLVDNAAYSYCFQPYNGVPIIPFYNNKTDIELKQVTTYLKEVGESKNMRVKNSNFMKLQEYHRYKNPKQLINQLYL